MQILTYRELKLMKRTKYVLNAVKPKDWFIDLISICGRMILICISGTHDSDVNKKNIDNTECQL